ncbi:MAG: hypothetical protein AAB478_00355 [Patescibacteria group bacterium]
MNLVPLRGELIEADLPLWGEILAGIFLAVFFIFVYRVARTPKPTSPAKKEVTVVPTTVDTIDKVFADIAAGRTPQGSFTVKRSQIAPYPDDTEILNPPDDAA